MLFARTTASTRIACRAFSSQVNSFAIPVVDFDRFRRAPSTNEKRQTAEEIVSAFKKSGFIYLSNHGIETSEIQQTFQKSAEFFKLPKNIKETLAWEDPRANRGYVSIGRERVTQSADPDEIAALRELTPDYKESMEIGRDWDTVWKNRWPSESLVPGFKQRMLGFYKTCHELHVHVMRSIALGLDLPESFFDASVDEQCHNLRLLSYPPIKTSLVREDGQHRAGAHSDYGSITLLFQDSIGGLEVQNPQTGEFIPALPIDGTIIVNVGDLLARWSNDVLRSTLHRVVAPPAKKINDIEVITPLRRSIAFFCNPNFSATISCLPNCGEAPKHPPINTSDYIVGRLAATYL